MFETFKHARFEFHLIIRIHKVKVITFITPLANLINDSHQLKLFNHFPFISLKPLKIKFHYFVNVLYDLKSMSKQALPFLEQLLSMIYASDE